MTVCINAICKSEDALIFVSDQMISIGGYMGGDSVTLKADPLYYHWYSQFSAADVSHVTPIYEAIDRVDESHVTLDGVSRLVKKAYKNQRLAQIEDEVLGAYGLNWKDFKEFGRARLNDRDFELVTDRIKNYDLGLDMLVGGFDRKSRPHIFTVTNPGKVNCYDKIGFWAVGGGQHLAMASLFSSNYNIFAPLEVCLAKVLCAKFAAEAADGVGEDTWSFAYTAADETLYMPPSIHAVVKNAWLRLPRIPTKPLPVVRRHLDEALEEERAAKAANSSTSEMLEGQP